MRRLLVIGVGVIAVLVLAGAASALTPGATLSCTFSPLYGTPDWSQATGAPTGTKTVCSKTTITFDHNDTQCIDGQLDLVPVYLAVAEVDFYLGKAVTGDADADGYYRAVKPQAAPSFVVVLSAGYVDDSGSTRLLGSC